MKNIQLAVTDWSPNGTNDLVIIRNFNTLEQTEEVVSEATFGLDINRLERIMLDDGCSDIEVGLVTLAQVLKHIAVSPVSDGSETLNALKRVGLI